MSWRRIHPQVLSFIACAAFQLSCASAVRKPAQSEPSGPGATATTAPKPNATVFISAELRGYLGPCGCTQAMLGGIDRAAFQVVEARRSPWPILYFDAGDALFGSAQLRQSEIPQQQRKAQAIAEVFARMGVQARAVGELDESRGAEFRESLGLPDLKPGLQFFQAGPLQLGLVIARSAGELISAANGARSKAEFVLAILHQNLEEAQRVAADPALDVDLLVAAHSDGEFAAEENRLVRGRVPIVRIQSKGRALARVDLFRLRPDSRFELLQTEDELEKEIQTLDLRIQLLKREINLPGISDRLRSLKEARLGDLINRREQIASSPRRVAAGQNAFAVRFIPLESTLPRDRESELVVEAYERDIGILNLAWAQAHGQDCPPPAKGEAAFVGNEFCRKCHAAAFPTWDESRHARAYWSLEERGRQYDLDCIGCHVTGRDRPGGVCRLDQLEGRKNVGCESCHGAGSLHVHRPAQGNIVAKPSKAECTSCHNPENSPHFDFALYLPQILGPGHGAASIH